MVVLAVAIAASQAGVVPAHGYAGHGFAGPVYASGPAYAGAGAGHGYAGYAAAPVAAVASVGLGHHSAGHDVDYYVKIPLPPII